MLSATGWNDLLKVASPESRIVWLVHPEKISASTRAGDLAAMGYRVISGPWNSSGIVRAKANIPAAVVVDLSRSPSAGRDIAIAMRSRRALLTVPFVLVGGSPEAVAAIRRFLPDAIESSWHRDGCRSPSGDEKGCHRSAAVVGVCRVQEHAALEETRNQSGRCGFPA